MTWLPSARGFPAHAESIVKGEQGFLRAGNRFNRNAVIKDFRFHVLHAFPGLEEVGGQGFQGNPPYPWWSPSRNRWRGCRAAILPGAP